MTDLSIVIVTYNSADRIGKLLDSIAKSPDKLKKEIIVIDNASADKSAQVALKHKLKPIVIKNQVNQGFAKSVNQAIKHSSGEYIFLLNPDTKLVGGAIQILYDFAQKTKPLGAVVPRLVDPSGRNQSSAFYFPTLGNALLRFVLGRQERYGKYLPPDRVIKLEVAVMAAFLIPKAVLDQIGLLDERFFLYYEDIEFCQRLARSGLPLYYLPVARVMHVHGASGNFKSHQQSPLVKSARVYYGPVYFSVLNLVLWLGQKFEKLLARLKLR